MPVIEIHSPQALPPAGLLDALCVAVTRTLHIPAGFAWAIWHGHAAATFSRPEWAAGSAAPVVFVRCKNRYSQEQVGAIMRTVQRVLSEGLHCAPHEVYIAVQRVIPHELLVRGEIWEGDDAGGQQPAGAPGKGTLSTDIVLRAVGVVSSPRRDLSDDEWGGVVATIALDADRFSPDAVAGLEGFSHLEVVFFMHRVPEAEITTGKRHPRGRTDWPAAGIFAQRAKGRPNRIGVSRCRLIGVEGLTLTVLGLDAVDGTPVLDVKPYIVEFGPLGAVTQPAWASALMAQYYDGGPVTAGGQEE